MHDEHLIRKVLVRYCRSVDRQDWDAVRECYHAHAVHHHGMFQGTASEFIDYVAPHMASMKMTMHILGNVTVELDGDRARSEAYAVAYHRMESSKGGDADHVVGYRYLDEFVWLPASGWRIATRMVVFDWSRIDAVERRWSFGEEFLVGRRDGTDPSIRWLSGGGLGA